ncbi:PREDICTED: putative F-box/kelch-repeat protein At4g11750 [Camelina sativa]|uniref:F-box/kelch-repeat protein At4g11750 n=1 Tax=Camelina sativa TaxID=90675 RepID=A0ABM0T7Q1_CAMSA|nr:PREDICTED: putative F-box/kelch-repeat protein At4g11750 [Camelina sativa]
MRNSQVDLPYLPDDLWLNCLARVSRLYYPILSLVSKRFRSLVASLELYEIRTLLGNTENCLYVNLRFSSKPHTRWFTLCQRSTRSPNPNPNFNSRWFASCFRPHSVLTNHTMVSVPTHNLTSPTELTRNRIAIDSNIYMIGVLGDGAFSSRIFFMDCRSHTFHKTPSIQTAQKNPLIRVLDGKIYVVEGCNDPDYSNFIECLDPETQTWEHVPSPSADIRGRYVSASLVLDGKLYLFGDKNLVYKPKENKWDVVGLEIPLRWNPTDFVGAVVDNVIYAFGRRRMRVVWYDSKGRQWRYLKGLGKLPKLPKQCLCVRLVGYSGKIVVLWEKDVRGTDPEKKMIWCAEIALERRNGREVFGKIEWCDVVLTVPQSCSLLHFTTVTV